MKAGEIQIVGLKELEERLLKLERKAQNKVLRKALAAGGRVIVKAAKAKAAKRTGKLKKSITAAASVKRGGATPVRISDDTIIYVKSKAGAYVNMGFSRGAFYGQFVELGTKFMPSKPFLRPAMGENQVAAVEKFREIMSAAITKVEQDDA